MVDIVFARFMNMYSDMENQTIFHMFCFRMRAESWQNDRRSTRRNHEKIVEFICDFGRKNFV